MRNLFTTSVLIIVVSSLLGCAGSESAKPPLAQLENTDSTEKKLPFALKVIEEFNDGQALHILGTISAKTAWEVKDLAVRLTGMRVGEQLAKVESPLKLLLRGEVGPVLAPGEEATFAISIPGKEISDYQLELFWGREAHGVGAIHSETDENLRKAKIVLSSVSLFRKDTDCGVLRCPFKYTLSGDLKNEGRAPGSDIVLGVGYLWETVGQPSDVPGVIPEQETQLPLSDITLAPGQSRHISIELDQELRDTPEGGFRAVARVLSYKSR